jgi:hypothetical protein
MELSPLPIHSLSSLHLRSSILLLLPSARGDTPFPVYHHTPTYRGVKWPVLPEDAIYFTVERVCGVLDRLATTLQVLVRLTSSQDTEITEKSILDLISGLPARLPFPISHCRQN